MIGIGISISVTPLRSSSEAKLVYTNLALNRVTEVTLSVLFPVVGSSTSPTLLLGFNVDPLLAKMELNISSSSSSGKNVRLMMSLNKSKSNVWKKITNRTNTENGFRTRRSQNKEKNYNLIHLVPSYHRLYLSDTSQNLEHLYRAKHFTIPVWSQVETCMDNFPKSQKSKIYFIFTNIHSHWNSTPLHSEYTGKGVELSRRWKHPKQSNNYRSMSDKIIMCRMTIGFFIRFSNSIRLIILF